jgi:hypothetical protein
VNEDADDLRNREGWLLGDLFRFKYIEGYSFKDHKNTDGVIFKIIGTRETGARGVDELGKKTFAWWSEMESTYEVPM